MAASAGALREDIEALEHSVLDDEEADPDRVAAVLKQTLQSGRAYRDALRVFTTGAGAP